MKKPILAAALAVASVAAYAQSVAPWLDGNPYHKDCSIWMQAAAPLGALRQQGYSESDALAHVKKVIAPDYMGGTEWIADRLWSSDRANVNEMSASLGIGKACADALQANGPHAPRTSQQVGKAWSPGYDDKVRRQVRPKIVWSGSTQGLEAVIDVHCAPSGTLLSATVAHSSGNADWDAAALRAVQLTDPMPVDTDGKTPAEFKITLRPAG